MSTHQIHLKIYQKLLQILENDYTIFVKNNLDSHTFKIGPFDAMFVKLSYKNVFLIGNQIFSIRSLRQLCNNITDFLIPGIKQ